VHGSGLVAYVHEVEGSNAAGIDSKIKWLFGRLNQVESGVHPWCTNFSPSHLQPAFLARDDLGSIHRAATCRVCMRECALLVTFTPAAPGARRVGMQGGKSVE
jgi:hypothetical protein